jgi:hypothetical protein
LQLLQGWAPIRIVIAISNEHTAYDQLFPRHIEGPCFAHALLHYLGCMMHCAKEQCHGLRQFRLRGLANVNMEGLLIATGQNLKRWLASTGWGRRHGPAGSLALARALVPSFPLYLWIVNLTLVLLVCGSALQQQLSRESGSNGTVGSAQPLRLESITRVELSALRQLFSTGCTT